LPNPYGDGKQPSGYAPTGYTPPLYGGSPYGPPTTPPPGASSRNNWIVGGIVVGILGLMGVTCAGCCGFGLFIANAAHQETARGMSVDYRQNPKVQEEIGDIQEVTYNWGSTIAREDDMDVYDVRGSKGSGQFVVEEVDGEPISVRLHTGRGEWDITPAE
jgi:hypothetical protein